MRTHGRTTSKDSERTTTHPAPSRTQPPSVRASLPATQRAYGNRAVGALLGQPLEPGLRSRLESRLGADFTDVRLHVDARSPRELGAPAVTQGEHIYLAQGEHRPDSAAGARLLTHELAHVVQQRGPAGTPLAAGRAEAEADATVAGGATPTPGSAPAGAVQPAPPVLGRLRYPDLPWDRDRAKALSMLSPDQRGLVEGEEREIAGLNREQELRRAAELQGVPGELAEEEAAPTDPSLLERASGYAAWAGSTITGHSNYTLVRDRVPNQEGAELAHAICEHTRSHGEIADALEGSDNPERVAAAIMRSPMLSSSLPLKQLAGTPDGRRLLDLLHRHLTAGMTGPVGGLFRGALPIPLLDDSDQLMKGAARVMQARLSATPVERWAEAAAHPEKVPFLPFQMQNFNKSPQSPLEAWFIPGGKLRVRLRSTTVTDYPEEWQGLKRFNAVTVDLDPDEIIAVRRYDQGGRLQPMPARGLLQLHQEFLQNATRKVQLTGSIGTGIAGGAAGATTKLGKALLWGDRASLALAAAAPLVDENRDWLKENKFEGVLDTFDFLNAASQWYGLGRMAMAAPELLYSLHRRRTEFRKRRQELGESVPREREAVLDAIERQLAAIPEPKPGPDPVRRASADESPGPLARTDQLLVTSKSSQEMERAVSAYRRSQGLDMARRLSAFEQSHEPPPLSTTPQRNLDFEREGFTVQGSGPRRSGSRGSGGRAAGPGMTAAASGSVNTPPIWTSLLPETQTPPRPAHDTTPSGWTTGNGAEPQSTFQAYAPDPIPSVGSKRRSADAPAATTAPEPATAPRAATGSEPTQQARPSGDALDDPTPLRLPGERSREQSGGLTAPGAPSSGPMTAPRAEGGGPRYFPPARTTPPPVAEPEEERTPLELAKKVPLLKVRRGVFRMTPELRALFRDLPIYLDPVKNEWMDSPGVLQPDHFVPVTYILNEIIGPQRINLLTNEQISALLTYEGNIAAFPAPQNYSKQGLLPSQWRKFRDEDIDPAWSEQAYRFEQEIIAELTHKMNDYIIANQAAAAKPKKKKTSAPGDPHPP
ncbi:eCIS core domain-containing protein [Streptomyces flaveus]|uniref:eCIS core domain-containing protein n=1 Tax=Streptomyces flaveus TaxID=66370 RepID=A0A917VQK4_9ACTN|nr:DUF4157 domain-containing protein [Streptomyces flaveus]GGL04320.1 hypothetical protein GCM10010094_76430 [Streptomyces flaveus]